MTKLIPPLSDLVALSQNPIQGALRAQILPLIEKRGVYLCRRLVTKPLSVENTQHRLMFLNRQRPGMAAHLSRLCSGILRSVIARPCHAQCLTGGLYPQGTLLLPDHRHQSFSTLCFSSIPRISETFFFSSTKPSAARKIRSLYSAVYRRRTGLAITSTSEGDNPNPSIVSIIDSLLAPYSTLNSRRVSVSSILAERDGNVELLDEDFLEFFALRLGDGKDIHALLRIFVDLFTSTGHG